MSDPIIDLVTRIKNGYMSGRETVESPHSNYREEVLKKLKALRYIKDYKVSGEIIKKVTVTLAYDEQIPAVTDVKFFSTPGRRVYKSGRDLRPVLRGMGYSILSTSKGIMTNIEARKTGVGGELLFNIW